MVDDKPNQASESEQLIEPESKFRSLRSLIEHVSGKSLSESQSQPDSGIAEVIPFPFLAMVGQVEMKYALLLALINPAIGGCC